MHKFVMLMFLLIVLCQLGFKIQSLPVKMDKDALKLLQSTVDGYQKQLIYSIQNSNYNNDKDLKLIDEEMKHDND